MAGIIHLCHTHKDTLFAQRYYRINCIYAIYMHRLELPFTNTQATSFLGTFTDPVKWDTHLPIMLFAFLHSYICVLLCHHYAIIWRPCNQARFLLHTTACVLTCSHDWCKLLYGWNETRPCSLCNFKLFVMNNTFCLFETHSLPNSEPKHFFQ